MENIRDIVDFYIKKGIVNSLWYDIKHKIGAHEIAIDIGNNIEINIVRTIHASIETNLEKWKI